MPAAMLVCPLLVTHGRQPPETPWRNTIAVRPSRWRLRALYYTTIWGRAPSGAPESVRGGPPRPPWPRLTLHRRTSRGKGAPRCHGDFLGKLPFGKTTKIAPTRTSLAFQCADTVSPPYDTNEGPIRTILVVLPNRSLPRGCPGKRRAPLPRDPRGLGFGAERGHNFCFRAEMDILRGSTTPWV